MSIDHNQTKLIFENWNKHIDKQAILLSENRTKVEAIKDTFKSIFNYFTNLRKTQRSVGKAHRGVTLANKNIKKNRKAIDDLKKDLTKALEKNRSAPTVINPGADKVAQQTAAAIEPQIKATEAAIKSSANEVKAGVASVGARAETLSKGQDILIGRTTENNKLLQDLMVKVDDLFVPGATVPPGMADEVARLTAENAKLFKQVAKKQKQVYAAAVAGLAAAVGSQFSDEIEAFFGFGEKELKSVPFLNQLDRAEENLKNAENIIINQQRQIDLNKLEYQALVTIGKTVRNITNLELQLYSLKQQGDDINPPQISELETKIKEERGKLKTALTEFKDLEEDINTFLKKLASSLDSMAKTEQGKVEAAFDLGAQEVPEVEVDVEAEEPQQNEPTPTPQRRTKRRRRARVARPSRF